MNRQQAKHILDAYTRIRAQEVDKDAADSLREVILDAMTEYKYTNTWPGYGITVPNVQPLDYGTNINVAHGTKTEAAEHE